MKWNPFANSKNPARQAASELHAKGAKLEIAEKAILVDDLRKLSATERDNVRRYTEKKVFGNNPSPEQRLEDDSMIIADDVQINRGGGISSTVTAVAALATAGLLGYFALKGFQQPKIAEPAAAEAQDTNTTYRIIPIPGD